MDHKEHQKHESPSAAATVLNNDILFCVFATLRQFFGSG